MAHCRYLAISALIALLAIAVAPGFAEAQSGAGPLSPHAGARIAWAFSNRFGPDAEAIAQFTSVSPEALSVSYASTRGLSVTRTIRAIDRQNSRSYVIGFAPTMPQVMPSTTSLGISGASLLELRNTGRTSLSLIHDADLSSIAGELTLVDANVRLPVLVQNDIVEVPAVRARGAFASGTRTGTGEFHFLNNQNNPMMLQSFIQFSWEEAPRASRVVRVTASESQRSAMEQSLSTLRRYDLYGIHFDFDKATLRPESMSLIEEIALTLRNNPTWTLQIVGHTDSIGDPGYNLNLSGERAASVASALESQGIMTQRLQTLGKGANEPKATNETLQGRALNRRVGLIRTDR